MEMDHSRIIVVAVTWLLLTVAFWLLRQPLHELSRKLTAHLAPSLRS